MAFNDYGTPTSEARSEMRGQTRRTQAAIRKFADQASQKAKSTAAYLKDRPMKDVVSDARRYVVSNPGPALCGAIVVGFLAGRMIRRY
jgi:ElaB/YqjD/DUF883 family membrane-anchored ribosome-binding protein